MKTPHDCTLCGKRHVRCCWTKQDCSFVRAYEPRLTPPGTISETFKDHA